MAEYKHVDESAGVEYRLIKCEEDVSKALDLIYNISYDELQLEADTLNASFEDKDITRGLLEQGASVLASDVETGQLLGVLLCRIVTEVIKPDLKELIKQGPNVKMVVYDFAEKESAYRMLKEIFDKDKNVKAVVNFMDTCVVPSARNRGIGTKLGNPHAFNVMKLLGINWAITTCYNDTSKKILAKQDWKAKISLKWTEILNLLNEEEKKIMENIEFHGGDEITGYVGYIKS